MSAGEDARLQALDEVLDRAEASGRTGDQGILKTIVSVVQGGPSASDLEALPGDLFAVVDALDHILLIAAVVALVDACAGLGGQPPVVVALGACASSGGPYWDSYAVTKGVDALVEVDVYVPGCPPPPDALRSVLDELRVAA